MMHRVALFSEPSDVQLRRNAAAPPTAADSSAASSPCNAATVRVVRHLRVFTLRATEEPSCARVAGRTRTFPCPEASARVRRLLSTTRPVRA